MVKAKTNRSSARGRPPTAPELIRRNRVVTLLTDTELQELTQVAEKEGKSVSALVHEVLLRFFRQHRKKK